MSITQPPFFKPDSPVHEMPPVGSNVMPCCGKTPFEVSMSDRIAHPDAVRDGLIEITCGHQRTPGSR